MTKQLQHQQVQVRSRRTRGFVPFRSTGGWQARTVRAGRTGSSQQRSWRPSDSRLGAPAMAAYFQRGTVTQSTVTVAFALVSLVSVVLLGFLYLQQVFGTASQGADVQSLEEEIVELRERQRELELEGAELRSIQTVEQRIQELNLVETEQVAYLPEDPERVAFEATDGRGI